MWRSKYKNKKVTHDGRKFDSLKEKNRYIELQLLVKAGEIFNLKCQPEFKISKGGSLDPRTGRKMPPRKYRADFAYIDKSGESIVEDVKSKGTMMEPLYRLKRQLFVEQYPQFTFLEIL